MANAKQCDGCKKISPTEEGYYIANNWTEVTVKRRFKDEYLFCQDCLPSSSRLIEPTLKVVFSFLKKFLNVRNDGGSNE